MKINKIVATVLSSLLIVFNTLGITAFAETSLPDGAVKGLPERLAALDDEEAMIVRNHPAIGSEILGTITELCKDSTYERSVRFLYFKCFVKLILGDYSRPEQSAAHASRKNNIF